MSASPTVQRIGKVKFFDDLKVLIHNGDIISESIFEHSVWEESLSLELLRIAQSDGGMLVDVGANIGYFSLLWAKAKPRNEVMAFEASPRIYPQLLSNVKLNGLSNQIHCLGVALSDSNRIHEFVLGPEEQTGWGGLMDHPVGASCKVVCVKLDEIFGNTEIRLLKIDVEGADTLVLKGCERLLKAGLIKEIYYEQNLPRMMSIGVESGEAKRYLESLGYQVEALTDPSSEVTEWHAYPRGR